MKEIVKKTVREYGISYEELLSTKRPHYLVSARVRIARELRKLGWTVKRIGRLLRRDHATVCYYLNHFGEPAIPAPADRIYTDCKAKSTTDRGAKMKAVKILIADYHWTQGDACASVGVSSDYFRGRMWE